MMDRIDRVVARLSAVSAVLACVLIGGILVVMVTDVARRNMTGGSLAGAYEVVTMMLVGVAFLGLAWAERSGSNIKLTLVTSRLPEAPARFARTIAAVLTVGICAWFTMATWDAATTSIERGEYSQGLLSIPLWPGKLVISLGFALLTAEFCMSLRRAWRGGVAVGDDWTATGTESEGERAS
ncbi:TRAP transporter small permease [Aeromicrobium sp. CF4.19]|uniref:TRAP transporter small permease n=1 Tax=Aeromicrobium sp. CF4.19 TaxID=3373082 RepID=UPI003EE4E2C1